MKYLLSAVLLSVILISLPNTDVFGETFMDFRVSPLGQADIYAGDTLEVYNMGWSGLDGVEFDLNDRYQGWEITFDHLYPGNTNEVGSSIKAVSIGIAQGTSGQVFASTEITKVSDNEWELRPDVGTDTWTVIAYLNGEIVYEDEGVVACDEKKR